MPAVFIHDRSPHGEHVVEYQNEDGSTHHTRCDTARAAELLAAMVQKVLDAETAFAPGCLPAQLMWAIRDSLSHLAHLAAAAEAAPAADSALVCEVAAAWKGAAVMGFACSSAKHARPLIEALGKVVLRSEQIESRRSE